MSASVTSQAPYQVGMVGVGFMGWIHWLAYQRSPRLNVAVVCSRDAAKRAGDWTGIKGNFGPPGEKVDLSGLRVVAEFDELLSTPEIDVVDICLPPHLHADAARRALEAGKHVFCEKPLALTAEDCNQLVELAQWKQKLLLVGQVLPMFPEFAYVLDAVQSGRLGKPLGGYFKRVISDPSWLPDFYDPQRCGGPLIDLHVHDAHLIRLLFGMPTAVTTRGRFRGEVVEYCQTLFDFVDPSLVVAAGSGVINQQGRGFTHGFEMHLERATLQYEMAVVGDQARMLLPLTVFHQDGAVEQPELPAGDSITPFVAELEVVVHSIECNQPSRLLSGEMARDAIVLCHRQTQSAKTGQKVSVD